MENEVFVVVRSKRNGAHCVIWKSQWDQYLSVVPAPEYDYIKEFSDKKEAYKFSDNQNEISHIW